MKTGKETAAVLLKKGAAVLVAAAQFAQLGASWQELPEVSFALPYTAVSQSAVTQSEEAAETPVSTEQAVPVPVVRERPVESASALISWEEGGVITLGEASISIPPYALSEDTEISVTRLYDTERTGEGMENVTAGGGGYRFLPAGTQFVVPVTVRLPFEQSLLEKPAALEELSTWFYNTESKAWEALNKIELDREHRVLASATMHFTDMINGTLTMPEGPKPLSFNINSIKGLEAADPGTGVIPLQGLEPNYTGAGNFSFELEVPPGHAGMQPKVTVGYSSDGGNSVLGRGFNLEAGSEITYDTRRGLPQFGKAEAYKGTFSLDGTKLRLMNNANPYRYKPLKEAGFETILHYTGAKDYWQVTDKSGTVRVYGLQDGAEKSWGGGDGARKYRWLLESVTDSFGNRIRYRYFTDDGELYLETISYTEWQNEEGAYRIAFGYEDRGDVRIDGRGGYISATGKRLGRIDEYHEGAWVRGYAFEYRTAGDFGSQDVDYGISQLKKFGQLREKESREWFWAYEFGYIGFPTVNGEKRLFDDQKEWPGMGGAIHAQTGESGGANGAISGGAGIGPSDQSDVRATVAGQYGSESGSTTTKRTLIDINGDGMPDNVHYENGKIIARLNNGNGFDGAATAYDIEGGGIPVALGLETTTTRTSGMTMYGGATLNKPPNMGGSRAETQQDIWTDEEIGFNDINGDGLIDLVKKGAGGYWQNTGSRFMYTSYLLTAAPLEDLVRWLGDDEKKRYDAVYYQQAPFRAWRAPVRGTVTVTEQVSADRAADMSIDGISTYVYKGAGEIPRVRTVSGGAPSYAEATTLDMASGEAVYFLSDAHSDISAGDDITWNIGITYTRIAYFEGLDRNLTYYQDDLVNSDGAYLAMLYAGQYVPGVLSVDGFNLLLAKARPEGGTPLGFIRNGWTPDVRRDQQNNIISEPWPVPLDSLFTYYKYDAGKGRYLLNEGAKSKYDDRDWQKFQSQIVELIHRSTVEERLALASVTLGGTDEAYTPNYDAARNRYYYGKAGNPVATGNEYGGIGHYRDGDLHLDTYDGEMLVVKGNTAYHGAEAAGTAVISGAGPDPVTILVNTGGSLLTYNLGAYSKYSMVFKADEFEELLDKIEAVDYAAAESWKTVNGSGYGALKTFAGAEGDFVELCYEPMMGGLYRQKTLDGESKERLNGIIGAYVRFRFAACYTAEADDTYRLKAAVPDESRPWLDDLSETWNLGGWGFLTREVRNYQDVLFPAADGYVTFIDMEDDRFYTRKQDVTGVYTWDSGTDFSSADPVTQGAKIKQIAADDPSYEGEYQIETVETLYGGYKQWYYGFWLSGQEQTALQDSVPFSEKNLNKYLTEGISKEVGSFPYRNPETPIPASGGRGDIPFYARAGTVRQIEGEVSIVTDSGSGKVLYDPEKISGKKAALVGPVTISSSPAAGGSDVRFAPWIEGDHIHTNRVGGDAYDTIPGMLKPPVSGGPFGMISLSKSHTSGTDVVKSVGGMGLGGSSGSNDSTTTQSQGLRDINGDGYADIVQQGAGGLLVLPGGETAFGASYPITGGGPLSVSVSDGSNVGVTMNGLGGQHPITKLITGGGSGTTSSDGTNIQQTALLDINGDGLPDYLDGPVTKVNIGPAFVQRSAWAITNISTGVHRSNGMSSSIGGTPVDIGIPSKDNEATGKSNRAVSFNVGLSGSVNYSNSYSKTNMQLIDMNGDGLPDRVTKTGNTFLVEYNTGSAFTGGKSLPVANWNYSSFDTSLDTLIPTIGFASLPFFGSAVMATIYGLNSSLTNPDINGISYTSTRSWGLTGGLDVSFQFSIPLLPTPLRLNIPVSTGGSVSWSSNASDVSVQTMDIDGDGLPDRVLRKTGTTSIYVMRNLTGQVGLLNHITVPQGGTIDLEYAYEKPTVEMPQSKYVLSRVTRSDGDGAPGRTALDYESEHAVSVEFSYEDGYYDRTEKESYGFEKVTATTPDQTRAETVYYRGIYYLKGVPKLQRTGNAGWSTETLSSYDLEGIALITKSETTVRENAGELHTSTNYYYDADGNVVRLIDEAGEGTEQLSAEISYWGDGLYRAHPVSILVKSNGTILRQREGSYQANGALNELTQYSGTRDPNVVSTIEWDDHGNIKEIRDANGAYVRYEYDGKYKQFPETIKQGGGGTEYASYITWKKSFGLKETEKDENGNYITYVYDDYGRLIEVYSPYDTTMPAVKYEYYGAPELPGGENWYAVTANKISFDQDNGDAIQTVIVIDGFGRAIVTAKTGEIRLGDRSATGWNIGGGVSYDEKGRAIAQGQPEFIEDDTIAAVLDYNYPAREGYHNGIKTYGLRLPTVTEYDTQDRPVKVTL
ncbi:MAG: hypothetical protein LBJ31_10020, partial [Treponema sp.]|nr:hypothetical protein [Treponema sp.]